MLVYDINVSNKEVIENLFTQCRKTRWLRREIELPELFTQRTEELLTLIRAAGPLDVLCLQEFSTDKRIVAMFNDALGSK